MMGRKLTTEEFIKRARKIHGDRYDYSKVKYINNNTKVEIVCLKHGSFWQRAADHLRGRRCHFCHRGGPHLQYTTSEFIERAREIHGNKYDYSRVEYIHNNKKVEIICSEHGPFKQTPNSHVNTSQGCPKCGLEKRVRSLTFNKLEFIKRAKKVHGDRYDYSRVRYKNSSTKVQIICPEHGLFKQRPADHWQGRGGKKQHQRIRLRDQIKNEFAAKYNFILIRIPYTEFDNIETILREAIEQHTAQPLEQITHTLKAKHGKTSGNFDARQWRQVSLF